MSQITAFSSTTKQLFHSLEVIFKSGIHFVFLLFLFLLLTHFTQPPFIFLLLSDPWICTFWRFVGVFIMQWFSSCITHLIIHLIRLLFFMLKSIPSDSDLFYGFPLNSVLPLFSWSVQSRAQKNTLSSTWAIAKSIFLLSCVILKNKRCTWRAFLSG